MITYKKTENNITLCRFDSSTILQSVYYEDKEFLYIFFKRGNVYSYQPITKELYKEFENSESQGKYLSVNVKNNKAIAYRKETTLKEAELKAMINTEFNNIK
jgi:hypothetical protein